MMQMVELASKKFVCIIDESKLVDGLGGSKGDTRLQPGALPSLVCAQADACPLQTPCL